LFADERIAPFDGELAAALDGERRRQERFIELIASENYVSPRVLEAQGSQLTNKYADGYPGRRDYSGCEFADVAERLAIERAKTLFGAAYANVQPYSGSQANAAAYAALLDSGDTLLGMRAAHGGHITHGDSRSFSGQQYRAVHYGLDAATGEIDYDEAAALARTHRPRVIVAGFSAYSRIVDWRRFRAIADEIGAYLIADIAHVAGLIAAGLYPNPVPIADVTTTTTHKTLRGPRGGMILAGANAELARRIDAAVYPGTQGGPLMHVIAAKAVAFKEAMQPQFRLYQQRVLANARCMSRVLIERGYTVLGGGTDNHMLIVDLAERGPAAKAAEAVLEQAHIAINCIYVPGRPSAPAPPSGLRLGTPAVTTRGLREPEAEQLAHWVADLLDDVAADRVVARVRRAVLDLCARLPVYAGGTAPRPEAAPTNAGGSGVSPRSRPEAAPTTE
jgi:glycine hydroxymethyltransferase